MLPYIIGPVGDVIVTGLYHSGRPFLWPFQLTPVKEVYCNVLISLPRRGTQSIAHLEIVERSLWTAIYDGHYICGQSDSVSKLVCQDICETKLQRRR